jgi:aryl-alcohol dehydrogenase-like predicted oxidoreductase
MNSISLPRTDLRVSSLCLGTADFGAGISEADSFAMLDEFVGAGGNFLDTAAVYAAWTPAGKGSSERLIGRYLAARSEWKNIVVATKGGHPVVDENGVSLTARVEVEPDLNESLKNLGRDIIDLYYMHRDDPNRSVEEILAMLESFVQAGKIRYYAFSNWKRERAQEAHEIAKNKGFRGFVASQPLWSAAKPDLTKSDLTLVPLDDEYLKWHEENNFPAIPFSSQANGYFQKLLAEPPVELSAGVKSTYDSEAVKSFNRQRAEKIRILMKEKGLSATAVNFGFMWAHKFPVSPIIGPKNMDQLRDCIEAERQYDEDIDYAL